jgi:hypothetical protein
VEKWGGVKQLDQEIGPEGKWKACRISVVDPPELSEEKANFPLT